MRRALDEVLDVRKELATLPFSLGVADIEGGVELESECDAPEVLRELLERPRVARLAGARGHLRLQKTDKTAQRLVRDVRALQCTEAKSEYVPLYRKAPVTLAIFLINFLDQAT